MSGHCGKCGGDICHCDKLKEPTKVYLVLCEKREMGYTLVRAYAASNPDIAFSVKRLLKDKFAEKVTVDEILLLEDKSQLKAVTEQWERGEA